MLCVAADGNVRSPVGRMARRRNRGDHGGSPLPLFASHFDVSQWRADIPVCVAGCRRRSRDIPCAEWPLSANGFLGAALPCRRRLGMTVAADGNVRSPVGGGWRVAGTGASSGGSPLRSSPGYLDVSQWRGADIPVCVAGCRRLRSVSEFRGDHRGIAPTALRQSLRCVALRAQCEPCSRGWHRPAPIPRRPPATR